MSSSSSVTDDFVELGQADSDRRADHEGGVPARTTDTGHQHV